MGMPAVRGDVGTTSLPAMTNEQVDLIKRTIARGATDDELQMFLHICQRTGLDPFAKQIYAVKRWDKTARREVMAVQTGIDGYRLVAERTGRYAPGREPSHTYDDTGKLATATSYVKKLTADGTWHEVAATAHYAEYVQTTKEGGPTRFWAQMPHVMLAKVAEALALRRAFPMELSGIYTHEEMAQADSAPADPAAAGAGGGAAPGQFPEPRRAAAAALASEAMTAEAVLIEADAPPPTEDASALGGPLTLDGELSPEEKWGPLVTQKEIGSLMGLLDKSGVSTDALKAQMQKAYGVTTRKQLRRGQIVELARWLGDEAERLAAVN
jgi:phage recombination protein Bet